MLNLGNISSKLMKKFPRKMSTFRVFLKIFLREKNQKLLFKSSIILMVLR